MPAPKISGTIRSKNPLKGAVEVLPERLYYAALKQPPPSHNILASTPRRDKGSKNAAAGASNTSSSTPPPEKKQIHFFNIDNELVYWNFFLDFGPLNLGQLARFCSKLNDKLKKFPVVCYYSNTVPAKRANAIFLICAWQMLFLDRTPEEAYRGFDATDPAPVGSLPPVSQSQGAVTIAPLPPFHDASPCACTFDLTVFDCLLGFHKALQLGFFQYDKFDVEEYEYYEQVENGDFNWIVPGKILAFAGPSYERHVSPEGYCTLAPSDYIPYFKASNVALVVRLNKKAYDEQDFVKAGIDHIELFFLDGSCPPTKILQQALEAFEAVPEGKAFAVHCKAGLGRTGTCIGAYLMKHYHFTAIEAIAWMRICRPGCVIGPQQHYLKQIEARMWHEGAVAGTQIPRPALRGHIAPSSGSRNGKKKLSRATTPDSSSAKAVTPVAADKDTHKEAVDGRAGQADGLLAARTRRRGDTKTKKDDVANTTPNTKHFEQNTKEKSPDSVMMVSTPPITPEPGDRGKAVAMTPEQPKARLLL